MRTTVQRIKFPELFFGFVAPIGADLNSVLADFREKLAETGYQVVEIKATDVFPALKNYIIPKVELSRSPLDKRYYSYISYGNQLRSHFDDDAILGVSSIRQIVQKRIRFADITNSTPFEKTAFLIHQFKRKEEIDLLRSIYGRLFFQISVYSRKGARVDHLSRLFAKSQNVVGTSKFRSDAEALIQKDEDESDHSHGQRVAKIFHDADLIVSHDAPVSINEQISRFCDLVFSSNSISPTHIEYGMFLAKAAALRSLDLSRQVGAAIFSQEREIISLGSNEVPKATGGTYWCDDPFDDREYMHGSDSNERRKKRNNIRSSRTIYPR
ncbi:cytidine/deoxycytidylate deaminase family protein [Roseixanthobacter liquoris]|uniref:hypothetical protein n=1 Tax=Roseixanthobacter liquoris TaxID=3119921 RepID=UPI0037283C90